MADDVETERERYGELLQELRTVLPGVQVLLAFLLTAPFSNRFDQLDDLGRNLYAGALVGVALSATTLMAPAAYHRIAPHEERSHRLSVAIRLTLWGIGLLAVSLAIAVFVVSRFVFDSTEIGLMSSGVCLAACVSLWVVLPVRQRRADDQRRHAVDVHGRTSSPRR